MYVNKEELIFRINVNLTHARKRQKENDSSYSYFAGVIDTSEEIQAWLDIVESIEGPKRKRKVKA